MIVLVGMVASAIIYLLSPSLVDKENNYYAYVDDDQASSKTHEDHYGLLSFSPNIFFEILLPPIIFNSGYHINRRKQAIFSENVFCFKFVKLCLSKLSIFCIEINPSYTSVKKTIIQKCFAHTFGPFCSMLYLGRF